MGIITTSKSSGLSIFTPLIFEMQLINGALFLNVTVLFISALSSLTTNSSFYNNISIRIIT